MCGPPLTQVRGRRGDQLMLKVGGGSWQAPQINAKQLNYTIHIQLKNIPFPLMFFCMRMVSPISYLPPFSTSYLPLLLSRLPSTFLQKATFPSFSLGYLPPFSNKHPSTFQSSPPSYLQHQLITPLLPLTWVRGGPHTPPPLLTSNPQLRPRGLGTIF